MPTRCAGLDRAQGSTLALLEGVLVRGETRVTALRRLDVPWLASLPLSADEHVLRLLVVMVIVPTHNALHRRLHASPLAVLQHLVELAAAEPRCARRRRRGRGWFWYR